MTSAYSWVKFTREGTSPGPSARSGHTLTATKSAILCFGGIDGRKNEEGLVTPNADLYMLKIREGMIRLMHISIISRAIQLECARKLARSWCYVAAGSE